MTSIYLQMKQEIEANPCLLTVNSEDFWVSDTQKLADANPGVYLWIPHISGTEFYQIWPEERQYPNTKTLKKIVSNFWESSQQGNAHFYKITALRANLLKRDSYEQLEGKIERLDYIKLVALLDMLVCDPELVVR